MNTATYKYGRTKNIAKVTEIQKGIYDLELYTSGMLINKRGGKDFIEAYIAQSAWVSSETIEQANQKAKHKIKFIDGVNFFNV
jgi:hypothetical protein